MRGGVSKVTSYKVVSSSLGGSCSIVVGGCWGRAKKSFPNGEVGPPQYCGVDGGL